MNIEEVRNFALTLPGATEDMPYGPDWLIFRIEGKIFLYCCPVNFQTAQESFPKPFRIGLRGFFFKKQAP